MEGREVRRGGLDVKNREIFRPFSRFFTLYHTEQGRNLASQARRKLDAPNWLFAIFALFQVRAIFRKKKYRWGWGRGARIFDRMKRIGNGKSAHMGKGDMDMDAKNASFGPGGCKVMGFFLEILPPGLLTK